MFFKDSVNTSQIHDDENDIIEITPAVIPLGPNPDTIYVNPTLNPEPLPELLPEPVDEKCEQKCEPIPILSPERPGSSPSVQVNSAPEDNAHFTSDDEPENPSVFG